MSLGETHWIVVFSNSFSNSGSDRPSPGGRNYISCNGSGIRQKEHGSCGSTHLKVKWGRVLGRPNLETTIQTPSPTIKMR